MKLRYITGTILGTSALLLGGVFFVSASGTEKVLGTTTSCTNGIYGTGVYGLPYGQYGSDCTVTSKKLVVDKQVKDPKTGDFIDNIYTNDNKFNPEQTVTFRIKVTNSGNASLSNVMVKDIFPEKISYVSGNGSYNKDTRTLETKIDSLAANETKTIEITAKAAKENELPQEQGILCVTNQAIATAESVEVTDSAQVCVQKKVLGTTKGGNKVYAAQKVTQSPATGAGALSLLALLPASLGGIVLRKRASK